MVIQSAITFCPPSQIWSSGKNSDASCLLCNKGAPQTNKHVLSNCESPVALNRYTQRRDAVLAVIADWIYDSKLACPALFVDIDSPKFKPVSHLFHIEFRPDLAVLQSDYVPVLELTVCHETSMAKSKAK